MANKKTHVLPDKSVIVTESTKAGNRITAHSAGPASAPTPVANPRRSRVAQVKDVATEKSPAAKAMENFEALRAERGETTTVAALEAEAQRAIKAGGESRRKNARRPATIAKEAAGIAATQSCLAPILGLPEEDMATIAGRVANMTRGDLELPNGETFEIKTQAIDPSKYGGKNYVELAQFEFADDFGAQNADTLADMLGLSARKLKNSVFTDHHRPGRKQGKIGEHIRRFRNSMTSLRGASAVVYVNPGETIDPKYGPTQHLYLYQTEELFSNIREAIGNGKATIGAGAAAPGCLGVQIALPRWRFSRDPEDAAWRYTGEGDEAEAISAIRTLFSGQAQPTVASPTQQQPA